MKKTLFLTVLFSILFSFSSMAQQSVKSEYLVIHIDTRNSTFEIFEPGKEKLEFKSTKEDYLSKLTEIINGFGDKGWTLKSTDTYYSMQFGGSPAIALMLFLERKKE